MLSSQPRLYFAYGSDLTLTQMHLRCPNSGFFGLGFLRGYRWIISERGHANIIKAVVTIPQGTDYERDSGKGEASEDREAMGVYGILYALSEEDEEKLDAYKGIPHSYIKYFLSVEAYSPPFLQSDISSYVHLPVFPGLPTEEITIEALAYMDQEQQGEGSCSAEYAARMNRAIQEAVSKGMKKSYAE
jgi:gamma-glutamylcyclotransferase